MTSPHRISYAHAALVVGSAASCIRNAGHKPCRNTLSVHEHLLKSLDEVSSLLNEIEVRRQERLKHEGTVRSQHQQGFRPVGEIAAGIVAELAGRR